MHLNKLPSDIIILITEYIDIDKTSLSFYSTCKEIRRYQKFLYLNYINSLRYIEDLSFRDIINNRNLQIITKIEDINTNDLDIFLNENSIKYKRTLEDPYSSNENGYIRYYLYQEFNASRHYFINIHYDNDKLIELEYKSEKYNYIISLFEEENKWENINKTELFRIILKHMTIYVD